MTGFVFEVVSELALFGFLPLFATVATVWFVWRVLETIDPKEVKSIQNFLTYIVPFVMLFYFGLTILIYDRMLAGSHGWHLLPLPPSSLMFLAGAVIYIGLAVWLWS